MPRVGQVDGVDIYVQDERNAKHKEPHYHAYGSGWAASISLKTFNIMVGKIPNNKRKAVLDYGRRHQGELMDNYRLVQTNGATYWIED